MTQPQSESAEVFSLSLMERAAYGIGGSVYAVKDAAFVHFVPFFYAQVLGLSPELYGLTALIGQLSDAVTDPLIGSMSDKTRSRFGRRHPWMFAAAIPLAICYLLLFRPPEDLSQWQLFGWIAALSVALRTFLTMFSVPHAALGAELSSDFVERTRIVSYRVMMGWFAGVLLPAGAYAFVFRSTQGMDGRLITGNYQVYAGLSAIAVLVFVLVSTLGTRAAIPHLPKPTSARFSILDPFRDLGHALRNRNFRWVFAALLVLNGTTGVTTMLGTFTWAYFWEFEPSTVGKITLFSIVPTVFTFFILRPLSARLEKNVLCNALTVVVVVNILWWYGGRLLGVLPDNHTTAIFVLALVHQFFVVVPTVIHQSVIPSMVADIADEEEVESGTRKDGVFQAAVGFAAKVPLGLGQFAGGMLYAWVGIAPGTQPGQAAADSLFRLGMSTGPIAAGLFLLSIVLLSRYRLTRKRHTALRVLLDEKALEEEEGRR